MPEFELLINRFVSNLLGHNWGYKTEPEKLACLRLKDGVCNWPKGRALGGTSVINYMVYNRGHKDDFNRWSNYGNYGWSYSNVLHYFKKSERIGIESFKTSKYRGHKGYVDVQHPAYRSKLLDAFIEAGEELGYSENDPNAEEMLGFSQVQATIRNGRRWSAAKAYLRPIAKQRKNLFISMRSWVKKILIDPNTKIAFGVEFVKNKQTYRVNATKEVILSAGAIASPQLLMLSGVGPEEHLREFGISVIHNSSVGFNLQDHIGLSGLVFRVNESITINERKVQRPTSMLNYFLFGRGPFTSPGGAEGLAFVKTPNSTEGKKKKQRRKENEVFLRHLCCFSLVKQPKAIQILRSFSVPVHCLVTFRVQCEICLDLLMNFSMKFTME